MARTGLGADARSSQRHGVLSYPSADPWHLAYTPGVHALDVTIDGEQVLAGGTATRVDPGEVRIKAAEQAQRLFAALDELD